MVLNDRNVYGASMLAAGHADAMVTGATRNYQAVLTDIRAVLDPRPGQLPIGVTLIFSKGRLVFVADTNVHEMPSPTEIADIAIQTAGVARRFGHEPRVAFLSYSTFGFPKGERGERIGEAVRVMDQRKVDFEYDGEMAPDVALDREKMLLYPFCRLSDVANVLIMPAIQSASISTKLLREIGGVTTMGPLLVGLDKSVQIAPLGAKMSDIYNMAVLAAYDINR
jgi:malate dehydrogenase (oxaloacetate-decarboxylating)(NADP+)